MYTALAEVELDDASCYLTLASPFAPIRFAQHAPGGDFWRTAFALDHISLSDLRAMVLTACPDIDASDLARLMLPKNKDKVLAGLTEAVQSAVDALETSRLVN